MLTDPTQTHTQVIHHATDSQLATDPRRMDEFKHEFCTFAFLNNGLYSHPSVIGPPEMIVPFFFIISSQPVTAMYFKATMKSNSYISILLLQMVQWNVIIREKACCTNI